MDTTKQINVRLTEEEQRLLKLLVAKRGVRTNVALIALLIREAAEREKVK